ncbi:DUF1361 domain-containing protein [Brevibacillus migulae]|uniref:DUF1361 domain-containing protein n=1 Tax=Brevibacillus migulae TaxID=1644114 RepID=UPI00106EE95B|nr:DUF1361 domain-containing protein [Brevibacillus migulae]
MVKKLFIALLFATILSGCLLAYRYHMSGTITYFWLFFPNLFLAWIPFWAAWFIHWRVHSSKRHRLWLLIPGAIWLFFLPNAPYMLTDLLHLSVIKESTPIHLDLLVILSSAVTAYFLGFSSLLLLQDIVAERFNHGWGWVFSFVVLWLCGIGVYLGRFLRWNSWDLVDRPLQIILDVFSILQHHEAASFVIVFSLFLCSTYAIFYASTRISNR